ncbi:MAG: FAD-binding oxidoreductase [Thermodesulfobacteriota bacterium]|nr:FAD-binding oxidoreductase [Thermodesulfobacteriota bacterium]
MKYCLFSFLCALLLVSCTLHPKPVEGPAKPFKSDGCSCWPDWNYYECCYEHDKIYWAGGSPKERRKADIKLMDCVAEKGHEITSVLIYLGVRIGGHGWFPTPFRWGFGHPWPEGYFQDNQNKDEK